MNIDFHPNYDSLNVDKLKTPLEGYEPPITLFMNDIYNQILEQRDNAIMTQIQTEYGITCGKQELTKALMYDRGQYDKGFQAGYEKAKNDILNLINNLDSYSVNQIQSLILKIREQGTDNEQI